MKKIIYASAVILIVLALVAYWYYNQTNTKLTIYNSLPYITDVSVRYVSTSDTIIDKIYTLKPGEIVTLDHKFEQVDPYFFISHAPISYEQEFVDWHSIYGNDCDTLESVDRKVSSISKNIDATIQSNYILTEKISDSHQMKHFITKESLGFVWWKLGREGHFILKDGFFSKAPKYFEKATKMDEVEAQDFESAAKEYRHELESSYLQLADWKVVNGSPYHVSVAVKFGTSLYRTKHRGWYNLKPGEEIEFTELFYGETPNMAVYSYSYSSDFELVNYINNMPLETNGTTTYFQADVTSNENLGVIHNSEAFDFIIDDRENNIPEKANEMVVFTDVVYGHKPPEKFRYSGYYLLTDGNLPQLYIPSEENLSEFSYLDEVKTRAKVLHSSLKKQISFLKNHNPYDLKYATGFGLADYNGRFQPGVDVSYINEYANILGQSTLFQPGDVILEYAGATVFSEYDLLDQLLTHATTIGKGIQVPIEFKLQRQSQIITGSTLYFFNKACSAWPQNESGRAFWFGLKDGITLGFDDEVNTAFSRDKKKAFWYAQDKVRLSLFYPNQFLVANITSSILSPGRLVFKKLVSKKIKKIGFKKGLNRLVTNISLESIEGALWTLGSTHSLTTSEEMLYEIEQNILWSAVLGVAISSTHKLKVKM